MSAPSIRPGTPFGGRFAWAVGIEDTFISEPSRRTGRTLDEYELTQHDRRWREDLDRIARLDVRSIRYGLPWYRIQPEPERFDWAWADSVMERLGALGIEPIVDLVHYGCPRWMPRAFLDPDYPARVAAYAAAIAERYAPLTSAFTPLNEPLVTAWWCGRSGLWPPHRRGRQGYVAVLMAVAEGMRRTVEAIRAIQPGAVIVTVDAGALLVASDPVLLAQATASFPQQWLATDLLLGRVDERHPLQAWLLENGADRDALERLRKRPPRIDVVGVNFYPHLSTAAIDGSAERPLPRRYYADGADLLAVLQAYHEHFGRPVMVTETSDNAGIARRERWLSASVRAVRAARAAGVPVIGYTWWPLFSLLDWRYLRGRGSLESYLCHMGLWDLRPDADGSLERVPTRLVERYARLVASGEAEVGMLAGEGGG